jgi:tryptophan 2,3-dioxygenase
MSDQPSIIDELQEKYADLEQDPNTYLEGLKHAKPITYWDYIQVESLLSLQRPRTNFPDEEIFIIYHQVTELIFKMVLNEVNQITEKNDLDPAWFGTRVGRINRYFEVLTSSFDVMREGMELEQYLQFRNTLTPASGFQCASYRYIELSSTDLIRLVDPRVRDDMYESSTKEKLENIYWMAAGMDPRTRKKSLTLKMFEEKYMPAFLEKAMDMKNKNIWQRFLAMSDEDRANPELVDALRELDRQINVSWPLVHFRTAEHYLETGQDVKEATGGSDWKKYLHPKYQKRIFFPDLWTEKEISNWGT